MAGSIDGQNSVHDVLFVAFDFETTGTSPDKDQIVEIGAVCFTTGEVKHEYTTLVKPTIPIPQGASDIHGITDADVADAPRISECIDALMSLMKEAVFVAHNIRFDILFLNAALRQSGKQPIQNVSLVDTLQVARKAVKSPGYGLQVLAQHFGIVVHNPHRALGDAHTCRQCLLHCLENMFVLGNLTLSEILL